MRKTAVIVIALLLLLSLCGCGVKEKITGKVSEKITEGIIEKATGGDVDLDLEEGKIKIKGDDGEEVTMGETEWPKEGPGALIPKFKKGKIDGVTRSGEMCWIYIDDVKLADYKQYIEELKKAGITDDPVEHSGGGELIYGATRGKEVGVQVSYSDDGTMAIMIQAASDQQ